MQTVRGLAQTPATASLSSSPQLLVWLFLLVQGCHQRKVSLGGLTDTASCGQVCEGGEFLNP